MRNEFVDELGRARRGGRAGDAADRRPRLHGPRRLRAALPRALRQLRRRRAEHGRRRHRPGRGRASCRSSTRSPPSPTLRPYEFIRNGPALHELPVRVVGVGGGFDYGHNGVTHFALEDYAVMRAQPAITTVAPADADAGARRAARRPPTCRGRSTSGSASAATRCRGSTGASSSAGSTVLREGGDAAILAIGSIAHEARRRRRAAGRARRRGRRSRSSPPSTRARSRRSPRCSARSRRR